MRDGGWLRGAALAMVGALAACGGSRSPAGGAPAESATDRAGGGETVSHGGETTSAPSMDYDDSAAGAPVQAEPSVSEESYQEQYRPEAAPQVAVDYQERLIGADEQLLDVLAQSAPDCGAARSLRDGICNLSDRICDIAARHPADVDTTGRCADGRDRCVRARRDVGEACGAE